MKSSIARRHNQRGFSLTEVAVSLSVAGLLVGGVLKGVEMMEQARTLKSGKLLEETAIGHQLFVDKYQFIPGDLPGANELIASSLINGNGDNILSVDGNAVASDGWTREAYHYWAHLAAAGMGPSTTGATKQDDTPFGGSSATEAAASNENQESIVDGAHFPAFPLGGYMQVVSAASARAGALDDGRALTSVNGSGTLAFPEMRLNELYYRIGHGDAVLAATTDAGFLSFGSQNNTKTAVNQVDLWRLDAKFDDGRPASGRLMTTTSNCRQAASTIDGSAEQYVYNSNSASCLVLYRAANTGGSVAISSGTPD